MKKRIQFHVNEEAALVLDQVIKEANNNFDGGNISTSDVLNEMILTSKVNIKELQLKHTDLKQSLRAMASRPDIDLDTVLNVLSELKPSTSKKRLKSSKTEVTQ